MCPRFKENSSGGVGMVREIKRCISDWWRREQLWKLQPLQTHPAEPFSMDYWFSEALSI
jgi:hypothetical protein